jgi:hypothetical protein
MGLAINVHTGASGAKPVQGFPAMGGDVGLYDTNIPRVTIKAQQNNRCHRLSSDNICHLFPVQKMFMAGFLRSKNLIK